MSKPKYFKREVIDTEHYRKYIHYYKVDGKIRKKTRKYYWKNRRVKLLIGVRYKGKKARKARNINIYLTVICKKREVEDMKKKLTEINPFEHLSSNVEWAEALFIASAQRDELRVKFEVEATRKKPTDKVTILYEDLDYYTKEEVEVDLDSV